MTPEPKVCFTPRPWRVNGDFAVVQDVKGDVLKFIAVCENGSVLLPDAERTANAKLIAKSPEMFWELYECEKILSETDYKRTGSVIPSDRVKRIRKLIAEAGYGL